MAGKYSEYIGVKLSPRDKKLLDDSGYKGRHAVEYFLSHVTSEKHRLEVEKFFLEKELQEKKIDLIPLEQQVERINEELGIVNIAGEDYSRAVKNALKVVKSNYLFAKSKHPSSEFNLLEFIEVNDRMISTQAGMCEMPVEKFKEAVIDYVES